MEPASGPTTNATRDYLVTLVHGVGEHDRWKIAEAGKAGLQRAALQSALAGGTHAGLAGGRRIVVDSFAYSDERPRSSGAGVDITLPEFDPKNSQDITPAFAAVLAGFAATVSALAFAMASCLAAAPRAGSFLARLATALLGLACGVSLTGAILLLLRVGLLVPDFMSEGWRGSSHGRDAWVAPLIGLIALAFLMTVVGAFVGWLCTPLMRLTDLLGDVAGFVGDSTHRRGIVRALVAHVENAARRARPDGVILVGHSLGSLVAAAATRRLLRRGRVTGVTLVTCGSPISALMTLFPRATQFVAPLSEASIRGELRWLNGWRRSDPIGRSLRCRCPAICEFDVGPGGHRDYWGDPKMSLAVAAALDQPVDAGAMPCASRSWLERIGAPGLLTIGVLLLALNMSLVRLLIP